MPGRAGNMWVPYALGIYSLRQRISGPKMFSLGGGPIGSSNSRDLKSRTMEFVSTKVLAWLGQWSSGPTLWSATVSGNGFGSENAITWRTEMRKKSVSGSKELKLGKLHQVPLSHIMYVDIGKQTTALRRVENAAVLESLCFSLLTKEGSLDLEANSPRERDALVQCFSLVLDEVHAQNWRDIYRGPSSDMPSSFDEGDVGGGVL